MKKTHEEYMRIAKICGEHIGCELLNPIDRLILLSVHFIQHPDCPMCLEKAVEAKTK